MTAPNESAAAPRGSVGTPTDVEVEALAGRLPDREAAEALGVAVSRVRSVRRRLGVASFRERAREARAREVRAALGTAPDSVVAERFGTSKSDVGRLRTEAGVASWKAREGAVANATIAAVAAELDRALGRAPDAEVGERFDLSKGQVKRRRKALGVPPYRPLSAKDVVPVERLGQVSDASLAAEHGLSKGQVARLRRRLGIDSAKSRRARTAPVPDGTPLVVALAAGAGATFAEIRTGLKASGLRIDAPRLSALLNGDVAELGDGLAGLLRRSPPSVGAPPPTPPAAPTAAPRPHLRDET